MACRARRLAAVQRPTSHPGQCHDGEPLIFTDQFINGTCYAAVNLTDPQAQHLIDHNRALGACLLRAISGLTERTRRLRRWVEGEYIPYARAVFGMAFCRPISRRELGCNTATTPNSALSVRC